MTCWSQVFRPTRVGVEVGDRAKINEKKLTKIVLSGVQKKTPRRNHAGDSDLVLRWE